MHASQGVETRADEHTILFIEDEAINVGQTDGATRSQVDEVGDGAENSIQPVRWSDDDKFLAWAAPVGTGGEASTNYADGFNAVTFSLDHYNSTFSSADFAATLSKPMAAQNQFDYYATYPVPSSVSGTQVSFNMPSVQSGDFDGACDIMRASVRGNALVGRTPNQMSTPVWPEPMLLFEHIMHVLRIYVPANRNLMLREISRLEITFPDNVVGGTVSFDVARPDVAPAWSGQTNKVIIQMDNNPLNANGRYVWVFIKPGVMSGDVKFRAYNLQGEPSQMISTTLSNHNFQAQHITPFTLTIPKVLTPVTITFKCPDNTSYPNFLGETPNAMYVKEWPADIVAFGEEDNVIKALDGTFVAKFYYEAGELNTELPGKTMRVGFTSQSADVSHNEVTMTIPSTLSTEGNYTLNFALPYLFFEDFQNVISNSSQEDNYNGTWLTDANLAEWSGSRWVSNSANTGYITLNSYIGTTAGYTDSKWGRLDSPAMKSLLRENVQLSVSYNLDGERVKGIFGNYVIQSRCLFGMHNSSDAIGGGWATSSDTPSTGHRPSNPIEFNTNTNGFSTSMQQYNHTIENCSVTSRFTWFLDDHILSGAPSAKTIHMYIDNIKVSVGTSTKHTNLNYRTFFPNHQN